MKRKFTKIAIVSVASLFVSANILAQEIPNPVQVEDTFPSTVEGIKSDVSGLKNLKVSGYVQVQGQFVEKQDDPAFKVPSVAGGDFPAYSSDWARFGVRRGRIKMAYSISPSSQAVIQFDATEKGMGVKDAYIKTAVPAIKFATLTAGVFNRPFGYEIEYSSSSRETPERSRMVQLLFPQERDLGAMVTLQAPKTSKWNFVKLDVATIAGNGINADIDRYKDVITRLNFNKSFLSEKLKVSGGYSNYYGGFANQTKFVYSIQTVDTLTKFVVDSARSNYQTRSLKKLNGFDLQVNAELPWGLASLRGEYIAGQQPSMASSNVYPTTLSDTYTTTEKNGVYTTKVSKTLGDAYIRKVQGYYVYYVQNIAQTRSQIALKYDMYDPNTSVKGLEIDGSKATKTSAADIKYTTLGIGYIFKIDANTKIMFYGDFVKNENTNIKETVDSKGIVTDPGYLKDRKDNVYTIRLQYKF